MTHSGHSEGLRTRQSVNVHPYTFVELQETVGGRPAYIVNHKATWEIK
jgi:hypothetical protein